MTNNPKDVKNDPKRVTEDAVSIVWLARRLFWFEHQHERAIILLRCFQGLTDGQIRQILNGNATMKNSRDMTCAHYIQREEKGFRVELAKHLLVQK